MPGAGKAEIGLQLVQLYLWADLVRPSFVWHFPKILSIFIILRWLMQPAKRWPVQVVCMLILLVVMLIDIPIALNTYAAVWMSYAMATVFLSMCLPLVQFVDSMDRFKSTFNTLIAIYVVIALYASFHQGYGPAGSAGGQDENYVTATMAMALPMAIYASLAAPTRFQKILYLVPIPFMLLAVVVAANPSRGGFIGILFVLAYFVFFSKRRAAAISGLSVLAIFAVLMAGPSFWDEMATIRNTHEGTADHRRDLWFLATKMFISYPLTGVGADNFRWNLERFQTQEITTKYDRSLGGSAVTHSLYFELISELGMAGIILFSTIVVRNFRDLGGTRKKISVLLNHKQRTRSLEDQQKLKSLLFYAHALSASLIAFLVCSLFLSTFYYSYFWIQSAIIASYKYIADQEMAGLASGRSEEGATLLTRSRMTKRGVAALPKKGL